MLMANGENVTAPYFFVINPAAGAGRAERVGGQSVGGIRNSLHVSPRMRTVRGGIEVQPGIGDGKLASTDLSEIGRFKLCRHRAIPYLETCLCRLRRTRSVDVWIEAARGGTAPDRVALRATGLPVASLRGRRTSLDLHDLSCAELVRLANGIHDVDRLDNLTPTKLTRYVARPFTRRAA